MLLLIFYVLIALGFSFICSIAEAVILSVTQPYIAVLERQGKASGALLRRLKDDINSSLAAILTLNTIAHTVGAFMAGAQAVEVFGKVWTGVATTVLTILILVFSEIIPKTLGAYYWKQLAPANAYLLKYLIWAMYPLVKFSEKLAQMLGEGPELKGLTRDELAVMAELSSSEGQLDERESTIMKNLLLLGDTRVEDAMTPRTVVFALSEKSTVGEFFADHVDEPFSRIPLYGEDREEITGFVLRSRLLLAQASGREAEALAQHRRELPAIPEAISLLQAFDELLRRHAHIALVVDEFGGMVGVLTMEDVLETLVGVEIVDEADKTPDMQALARRLWQRRARNMGLDIEE